MKFVKQPLIPVRGKAEGGQRAGGGGGAALFSVVIPAFNNSRWLAAAVESALGQEGSDAEVIVIDDGSTDDTPRVLAKYAGRVKTFRQSNQGLSRSRNRGAREASGSYIIYLDSDDLLFPWALKTLREIVLAKNNPAVVLSRGKSFSVDEELSDVAWQQPRFDCWADYLTSSKTQYWIGVAGAIRRDVLLKCGGFDPRAAGAEDHDFWLRIGEEPGFVYLNSPPIYAHRQHELSVTRQATSVYEGIVFLLKREGCNGYPGGRERAAERRVMLARLVCWGVKRCFRCHGTLRGYRLYLKGLRFILRVKLLSEVVRLPLVPLSLFRLRYFLRKA